MVGSDGLTLVSTIIMGHLFNYSLSPQPFRCAHCHYSCNISGSLKRHYNRKHPNEEYTNVGTGELAADALIQQGS